MEHTLERITPDTVAKNETTGAETLRLHLDRYHFAGKHLLPGVTADIACGTGYGSFLLATEYAQNVTQLFGVDNDAASIEFARKRYPHPHVQYEIADAVTFTSTVPLDNIVSLETIEHLPSPREYIAHAASLLRQGGRIIASVPVTPSMDANPYHLSDFSASSFRKLFDASTFREIATFMQSQPYQPLKILGRREQRTRGLRKNLAAYYFFHPQKFLLRIWSLGRHGFVNLYMTAVFEKL